MAVTATMRDVPKDGSDDAYQTLSIHIPSDGPAHWMMTNASYSVGIAIIHIPHADIASIHATLGEWLEANPAPAETDAEEVA